jgi:very-short-patch-repair endonuclease
MAKTKQKALARILRRNQNDVEGLVWQYLADRRLGGYKFRRQHPIKDYILDFYCAEKKLAIELDGAQHAFPFQMIADKKRTNILEK